MFQGRSNALSFLGLPSNASDDNAKKAYRKMSRTMHPNKGGSTANFQKLGAAYEMVKSGGGRGGVQWTPEPDYKGPVCQFIAKAKRKAAGTKEYSSFDTINKNIEIGAIFTNGKLTDAFVQHPDFELSLMGKGSANKYWSVDTANVDKLPAVKQMLRDIQEGCGYPVCAVYGSKVGNSNYGSQMNKMMNMKGRLELSKILFMVEMLYNEWENAQRKAQENGQGFRFF
jgi:curved DNA-binding protein CbpA